MLDMKDYMSVVTLYSEYSACVDEAELDRWPDFFTEDCEYRIQPRENYERKLPLCTMWLEGRGMLKDRVYAVRNTLFHDPYYQRHVVGIPRVLSVEGPLVKTSANYLVIRTKRDEMSELFNAGRYIDTVQRDGEAWKFKSRLCIFDSELIPNSIIYPI